MIGADRNIPIHVKAQGTGVPTDPLVAWRMPKLFYTAIENQPERKKGNEKIASALARALEFSHVEILAANHATQYVYRDGEKQYCEDRFGQLRPRIEPADSHLTVRLFNADSKLRFNAHIYTLDDARRVPQRLMLISERKHIKENDKQSPQMWLRGAVEYLFDVDEKVDLVHQDDAILYAAMAGAADDELEEGEIREGEEEDDDARSRKEFELAQMESFLAREGLCPSYKKFLAAIIDEAVAAAAARR
ncbi:hypothetical protein F4778DRAFT_744527 [Xylariomycetidae sp. FL2044]|nr:hypothetical protein F4778DRAFT_744527 [Xylariomycetidae sp. FL2044]